MTRVKICGIKDTNQALIASAAGADFLGLVFAASRRQIMLVEALEIVKVIRQLPSHPKAVGVFVNSPITDVNFMADACQLDRVQLSGDEDWEYCRNIQRPIIKAIHISPDTTIREVMKNIENGYQKLGEDKLICLLDSHLKGVYGGTGLSFDWQLAKEIATKFPVLLAGGLSPENVGQSIQEVRPWGVDVSSGVETNGQKDIQKIKDFIRVVKKNRLTGD